MPTECEKYVKFISNILTKKLNGYILLADKDEEC